MHKKVPLSKIDPNPFRKMERYPIKEEKIEMLIGSMDRTGFWDNLVGREKNVRVEIAYGHHRWIAFKRKFGKKASMNVIIRKLSDEDMLRVMADENADEYGTSAEVEQETIRAVVQAYAEGKIELEKPGRIDNATRYAPSFKKTNRGASCPPKGKLYTNNNKPYTALTVAIFLGWTESKGKGQGLKANQHVTNPLMALEVIEEGLMDEKDCKNLSARLVEEIARGAVMINRSYKTAAKEKADPVEKQKTERKGRDMAKRAAKKAAKSMRPDPKTGKSKTRDQISQDMQMSRAEEPKTVPRVEDFVSKLTRDLDKILQKKDSRYLKLDEVIKYCDKIASRTKKNLTVALKSLIRRCEVLIDTIEGKNLKLKKD